MKKTILAIFLSSLVMLNTVCFTAYAEDDISVTLNGETLSFDVPPQLIDNRTMVPLRVIFEAMGASVDWEDDTRTVTATKGNERVMATVDSQNVYISGDTKTLDVPPMIVDGRTLVPVRFVAEAFGADVDWDESTRTVIITTKWDRTGDIPYYANYPTVPDFGMIVGVSGTGSAGMYLYEKDKVEDSDFQYYLSLMRDLGFSVAAGTDIYTCYKNGIYVDIADFGDVYNLGITLPDSQATSQVDESTSTYTTDQDSSAFEKLKNDIISKGIYVNSANTYGYVCENNGSDNGTFNTCIYYMVDDDEIRINQKYESPSGLTSTTILYLYNNDSAAIFITVEDNSGNEKFYAGRYSDGVLIQDYSDFKDGNLSNIENFVDSVELYIDSILKLKGFSVNLTDFGITVE